MVVDMRNESTNQCARTVIFVDIENMAGEPLPTCDQVKEVIAQLESVIQGFATSQVIVAASHKAMKTVAFEFSTAVRRQRSGPDGADDALLEEMSDLRVMLRYDRIVVCSGDGKFAEAVAWLGGLGLETTVVSLPGHLSKKLQLAAHHVVLLAPPAASVEFGTAS